MGDPHLSEGGLGTRIQSRRLTLRQGRLVLGNLETRLASRGGSGSPSVQKLAREERMLHWTRDLNKGLELARLWGQTARWPVLNGLGLTVWKQGWLGWGRHRVGV